MGFVVVSYVLSTVIIYILLGSCFSYLVGSWFGRFILLYCRLEGGEFSLKSIVIEIHVCLSCGQKVISFSSSPLRFWVPEFD